MVDYDIRISEPQIGAEEERAVAEVLRSGRLAQGPKVAEFEARFAEYVGARHGVACGNGTQALHLALLAHGVGPGDLVVVPAFSFVATATAVLMCGARPVFVDVEEDTCTMDMRLVNGAMIENVLDSLGVFVGHRTAALLPVHLYGHPSGQSFGAVPVIYDACQAHGAKDMHGISGAVYRVGFFGTSCWSFYATKNMTTGEGGMVTTDDAGVAAKLRSLRDHGRNEAGSYAHERLGYNYRMTEMQAAIGLVQLEKLPGMQERRAANAAYYSEALTGIEGLALPTVREGCVHAWHQYTVRISGEGRASCPSPRDILRTHLQQHGVEARVYYPTPLPQMKLFRDLGYGEQDFPVAGKLSREVLSLPVHPGMRKSDLICVVGPVKEFFQRKRNKAGLDVMS